MKTKSHFQQTKSSARAAIGAGRICRQVPAAAAVSSTPAEPFIKKAEVAQRLGRTQRAVEGMMRRRQIPYYKFGYAVAFRWSEITEHLAETCRVGAAAKTEAGSQRSEVGGRAQ